MSSQRNYTDGDMITSQDVYKKVKIVLWGILFANLGVAVIKMVVGYLINSVSLSTDGIHSLSDGLSNVVGIIGVTIASKPVDKNHPYGHKKSEIVASLFIGGMLLILGLKTLYTGMDRLIEPKDLNITLISIISLIITICINVFITIYERKKGNQYSSYILVSDSIHTKSDICISIGVLISLVAIGLGVNPMIDPIISIIISFFIIRASYEIFKESIGILSDKAVVEEDKIVEVLNSFYEIMDIHKIRSRGSYNDMYIDMHIMIDPNTTIEESHMLTHEIEEKIKLEINSNCQVIIHVEPYYNM